MQLLLVDASARITAFIRLDRIKWREGADATVPSGEYAPPLPTQRVLIQDPPSRDYEAPGVYRVIQTARTLFVDLWAQ